MGSPERNESLHWALWDVRLFTSTTPGVLQKWDESHYLNFVAVKI